MEQNTACALPLQCHLPTLKAWHSSWPASMHAWSWGAVVLDAKGTALAEPAARQELEGSSASTGTQLWYYG